MAKSADDSTAKRSWFGGWLGAGVVMLLALPFAGIGLAAAGWIVSDFWQWRQMQSWVATPATLVEAGLEGGRHRKRGSSVRATARYRYQFGGKQYQGDRVAIYTGRDNIGSYQQDRADELEKIEAGARQLTCYVNPYAPAEAVLFRDLRWGMLLFKGVFAVTFSAIGFGILIAAALSPITEKARRRREAELPDQPWLWESKWASGRLRSTSSASAIGMTIFATLWNAISLPGFALVYAHPERGAKNAIWIMALFPLVGAGLAVAAAYLWTRRLKWGVAEFEMAAVPGVLGGPVAGVVHVPARVVPAEAYVVRLACIKEVGSGDSSKMETLWDHEYEINRLLTDGDRTLIPVEFLTPSDLPPSGEKVTWKLFTSAAMRGVDFFAEFDVPVFKTAASGTVGRSQASRESATTTTEVDFASIVRSLGAIVDRDDPSGNTLIFPMARNLGMAAFMAIFAVGWTGATVFLFNSDAPRIFPWVVGAFNVVIVPVALLACFGRTRLAFSNRGVQRRGGIFGLGRLGEYPAGQIADAYAEKSGTKWGDKEYRRVRLRLATGKSVTLVSDIARPRDADRLAAEIRRVVGLSEVRRGDDSPRISLESALPAEFGGD